MPLVPVYFTAEMVRALPDDGNRYELVHGELLVSPSPKVRHQMVLSRLHIALGTFCAQHVVGQVLGSPADISWSEDSLVQPDLFVVPSEFAHTERWSDIRSLSLVIECLSPSTARRDRFQKRKYYQEHGVPMLWLIDEEKRFVEVWTPESLFPVVETRRLVWQPGTPTAGTTASTTITASAPFEIDLAELFAR